MSWKIIERDPYLAPYGGAIDYRVSLFENKKKELLKKGQSLKNFANGYLYYGFHRDEDGSFVYREWAPGADEMHLTGDFNNWDRLEYQMTKVGDNFEIRIPKEKAPENGSRLKALVTKNGVTTEHIPAYANYVIQNPDNSWCAAVHLPEKPYEWHDAKTRFSKKPLIYECHVGMAGEEPRVHTYAEFRDDILPRVQKAGYNTIQLMAVMEHPYYGSFGYQVSNFFAPSSRFGTPEDLKSLIDTAHQMNIRVLLDVVHSHAVKNTQEGLNMFDGTDHQYFRREDHPAWDTKLFDYGRPEVIHFLLSNLKYWMDEFHFDGFRFDGVTSMLYYDHGLGKAFTDYGTYFSPNTDHDAVTYLMLANELIHQVSKKAVTIAEDMSGMPGMCLPSKEGGIGFDYRLSMGVPDLWIKLLKEKKDEDWSVWQLWHELTQHRPGEKTIAYAESHDQALVGDKTIMFWLCDAEMYTGMSKFNPPSLVIDRGIALHKMIRLITFTLAEDGYLNFMGNEFGHPEWIDFPREGNGWSYHYCRRQWSLVDDEDLKYRFLNDFDRVMIKNGSRQKNVPARNLWVNEGDQVLVVEKDGDICIFNFSPDRSYEGYRIPVLEEGVYQAAFSTDDTAFAGFGRVDHKYRYHTEKDAEGMTCFYTYLPSRTAIVFKRKNK